MNLLRLTRNQLVRVTPTRWLQNHSFKQCSSSTSSTTASSHVLPLTCPSTASPSGICQVYLIGTAHNCQESCGEVRALINSVRPDVVFLECCSSSREAVLVEYVDKRVEAIDAAEFCVAYEEAIKYGAKVVLGDLPDEVTAARFWRKMPLQEKTTFVITLFILKMKTWPDRKHIGDIGNEMNMLIRSKTFPTLVETFVDERDVYMSYGLLQVAKKNSCIVAVVGRGHLQGMKKHWEQPMLESRVKDLLKIPPPPFSTIIFASFVGVFVADIVWGYLH